MHTAATSDHHRRALAARAIGDFSAAADAWRAVLQDDATDWQAALALKADMAALGRYAESDAIFRRARARFPDAAWIEHATSLYAYPQCDLPQLTDRARSLAAVHPEQYRLHRSLGDMLLQARDYAGAAEAFAGDATPQGRLPEQNARRYQALAGHLAATPEHGHTVSIAVINLDRNADRLAEFEAQFRSCLPERFRVAGIEGSRLSSPAVRRLGGDPAMRGTLGCFLSHAAAWEAMLARKLDHCLIVEDDVIPLLDLPARWGVFDLPVAFDLCFVNDRLAPSRAGHGFAAVPLFDAMQAFPAYSNAPGADGYLLRAAGARKLLDWVARDGFAGDVDWRLLAYGLSAAQCTALPADGHARGALLRLLPGIGAAERLRMFALTPPLIRTVPIASDREDENRAALA